MDRLKFESLAKTETVYSEKCDTGPLPEYAEWKCTQGGLRGYSTDCRVSMSPQEGDMHPVRLQVRASAPLF